MVAKYPRYLSPAVVSIDATSNKAVRLRLERYYLLQALREKRKKKAPASFKGTTDYKKVKRKN